MLGSRPGEPSRSRRCLTPAASGASLPAARPAAPARPPQPRVGGVGVVARVPGQAHLQRGQRQRTSKATRPSEVARGSVHEVSRPTRSVSRMTKRRRGTCRPSPPPVGSDRGRRARRRRGRAACRDGRRSGGRPRRRTARHGPGPAYGRAAGPGGDGLGGRRIHRPASTPRGRVLRRPRTGAVGPLMCSVVPWNPLCRTRSRGVVACQSPCPPRFSTTAGAADAAGARAGGRLGVAVRAVQALLGAGPARHGRNGPGMRAASRRRRRNRPRAPDRPEAERGPCGLVTRPCGTHR